MKKTDIPMTNEDFLELRAWLEKELVGLGRPVMDAYYAADDLMRTAAGHGVSAADAKDAAEKMLARGITNVAYAEAILRRRGLIKPVIVSHRGVDELDDPFAIPGKEDDNE